MRGSVVPAYNYCLSRNWSAYGDGERLDSEVSWGEMWVRVRLSKLGMNLGMKAASLDSGPGEGMGM